MARDYLHGYTREEQERLIHQSRFLEPYVYKGIDFSKVTELLEVGSGVGAQTEILLERFPHLRITSVEISPEQTAFAEERLKKYIDSGKVKIVLADATDLSELADDTYEACFICWFLEHVPHPIDILKEVKKKLRPNAYVTVSEVNNSSLFIDPYAPNTLKYWYEFNDHQWNIQGHPFMGLRLGNVLSSAGFKNIDLDFRALHFDQRDPVKKKEFVDYFYNLIKSANPGLVKKGVVPPELIEDVKLEFELAKSDPRGVFYYSFVRAEAQA